MKRISIRLMGLCVVAVFAMSAVAVSSASALPKALIDESTVTGGASSQEAVTATAQGYAVTVVSDAAWGAMTQAEFGEYELLIAGDPTCGTLPPGLIASAPVYGPVVMGKAGGRTAPGNRIVVGTDPALHDGGDFTSPGARGTIIREGIGFAGKQPGRTGMYFDSTCAANYYGQSVQTLEILAQLSAGSPAWTIDDEPPCGGSVSLIASNPSFSELTTASLEGWSCSVHESFPTFPSEWSALAVATDTTTLPTCGVDPNTGLSACGEAYILVAGSGIVVKSGSIELAPLEATDPAGTDHTVTAHVTSGGSPLAGQTVTFTVTGQNAGASGTCVPAGCVTDASGNVSFTYHDTNGVGEDTIKASFTDAAGSLQSATAVKHWVEEAKPTQLSTSLSGGGQSGGTITVPEGTAVSDSATLSGENASTATGTVEYNVYSDNECKTLVASAGSASVSGATVPASSAETLSPGTYYWQASYSGDSHNEASKSTCGAEVETVEAKPTLEPQPHWYSNGTLIPEGQVEPVASSGELTLQVPGSKLTVTCKVKDKGTIVNPAGGGAGTDETTEVVFSDCSGKASPCSSGKTSWCCNKKTPSPCPKGTSIELSSPGGSLRTHLVWAPGQPVRDVIEGIVLEVRCSNGTVLDTYKGTLMPTVGNSVLKFGPGSGELEDPAGGKATLSGSDKLKGPKGDERITAKLPPLPPHWYSNGTLIPGGEVEPVTSSGELTLQVAGSKLSVTCKVKDKGTIVNPAGGGAGTDETTEVVFSDCSGKASPCSSGKTSWCCNKKTPSPCPKGTSIELSSPGGSLRTHLVWAPGQPVRDVIEGIVLEVRCSNGTVLDTYKGTLMPTVGNSVLKFGPGSGELEDPAGGKATLSGSDKLKGPKGDERITVENPEGEPW